MDSNLNEALAGLLKVTYASKTPEKKKEDEKKPSTLDKFFLNHTKKDEK